MLSFAAPSKCLPAAFIVCLAALAAARPAPAQEPTPRPPAADSEEVVRVSTDLVQTDVMVFDKQGKFVDGLRPEQFELRVDGKPQAFTFFERIQAGTVNEDAQLSAARGGYNRTPAGGGGAVLPLDRGRTLFFFVDDLHLSAASAIRVRETLLRFITEELKQNDEAAVTSASGQIGFLQQLTGDKTVLRAAVARLNPRAHSARDFQHPPMTEVQALAVDRNDSQVIGFFVDALLRETPQMRRDTAEQMVLARSRTILLQSSSISANTLLSLESLVRGSAPLPGRKIVFFLSDGFLLNERDGSTRDRMRRLTDAAARAGAVIYSIDAQGLTSGMPDASAEVAFDPGGRLASVNMSELRAMQEPLFTLAHDTGGRALVNTNALNLAVDRALKETSVYYLLAWRPEESDERGSPKFRRIEISVKDRPELKVLVRRGFYQGAAEEVVRAGAKKEKSKEAAAAAARPLAERELRDALGAPYARQGFPTSLSLGYVNASNNEMVLMASLELNREALGLLTAGPQGRADVDVMVVAFDDSGKHVGSFRQELSIPLTLAARPDRQRVTYSNQFRLAPGLYQVRAAARERGSGRTGSAMQWVVIPDLRQGQFSLGSIFVGERTADSAPLATQDSGGQPQQPQGIMISVDRRFARTSWMRFMTHIYNAAAAAAGPPDVALQVQVFRDDQPVITAPLNKINAREFQDHKRIPYAAELALASLPAGRYMLQITAIDRQAKTSSSQRIDFAIE